MHKTINELRQVCKKAIAARKSVESALQSPSISDEEIVKIEASMVSVMEEFDNTFTEKTILEILDQLDRRSSPGPRRSRRRRGGIGIGFAMASGQAPSPPREGAMSERR